MHSSIFLLAAAFGATVFADSDCNENQSTCSSSAVAANTGSAMITSSSTLGPRQSAVTVVDTSYEVITSTNIDSAVYITSLPKSLYTRTTVVAQDTTLVPVLTPSVISGASTYVVTTITSSGRTSTSTDSSSRTAVAASSGTSSRASGTSTGASSASSTAGAAATFVPGAVGMLALGVAALL